MNDFNTPIKWQRFLLLVLPLILFGCGGSHRPKVDLDRVLAITKTTLTSPLPSNLASATSTAATPAQGRSGEVRVTPLPSNQQSDQVTQAFAAEFARRLNAAKLITDPLGVRLDLKGALVGFTDFNQDMQRDGKDKDVFRIEIDTAGGRLIATDLDDPTIRRDHHYGGYYRHGGYWSYYALGSMRGSQDGYYRSRPAARPNYRTMRMAPSGYAKSGSGYQSAGSARSRSGSRSFFGGK